jgi:putative transposase
MGGRRSGNDLLLLTRLSDQSFPGRFGSKEDAHVFCTGFFIWYNTAHRHSGFAYHTPESVHYGLATAIREQRAALLEAA